MRMTWLIVLMCLSGCESLVPEHQDPYWLSAMQREVGKNIFNWEGGERCLRNRESFFFLRDNILRNGNKNAAYFLPYREFPRCHYFFEYERESGTIVGFSYEEIEPLACTLKF